MVGLCLRLGLWSEARVMVRLEHEVERKAEQVFNPFQDRPKHIFGVPEGAEPACG